MTKLALVTGGSRGIGAATCLQLADIGCDILLSYRTDLEAANDVLAKCWTLGVRAKAVHADVSNPDDVKRLFAEADTMGTLGALINNAGIVGTKSRIDEMDFERMMHMFAVNTVGAFLCAGEAVKRMSTRYGGAGGVIVNVSSAAARITSPGEYVDYASSKAAMDCMTIGLSKEVADEGIRVNAVRPGLINTDIHASGGQPDRVERFRSLIPMQRGGEPEEIAATIVFMCSPASSYMTGAVIDVSGGR